MKYLFLLSLLSTTVLRGQTTFQKSYHSGETADFGRSVQQTTDGGFIITGQTALGTGPSDMYLLRTSPEGVIEWAKSFGGAGNEVGYFVQQTADSGYIIIGNTDTRIGGGAWDMYVVKTTSNGSLQWSKTIGGAATEEGRSIRQTDDGGFVITGRVTGPGGLFMCLLKLAANGTLLWSKTYGTLPSTDGGESVKQTADGGYIIAGTTTVNGSYDVFLVKTDAVGQMLWSKTFGDTLTDMAYDVEQTNDGGYIVTGTYGRSVADSISTSYYGDVYLIKTTAEGTLQWAKTFGNTLQHAVGYTVQQTYDGGYVVAAERNGAYLLKTDANGSLLWSKIYGSSLGVNGKTTAHKTNDGGFILTGTVSSAATGFDVYLIKTNAQGESGCHETNASTIEGTGGIAGGGGAIADTLLIPTNSITTQSVNGGLATTLCTTSGIAELPEKTNFHIYPNPASSQFTIQTTEVLNNATLTIYSTTGQLVKRINNLSGQSMTFFREDLTPGLYVVYLTQAEQTIRVGKLVLID